MSDEFTTKLTALRRAGNGNAALALCEHRMREMPGDANAHWQYGRLLAAANRMTSAIRSLTEACRLLPQSAPVAHDLARALASGGHLEEARSVAQSVVIIDPDFAAAHNHLGQLAGNAGDLAAAQTAFERALAIDPDFTPALENLANAADMSGDRERAAGLWVQLARRRPDDAGVQRRVGARFRLSGQYELSLDCFARWSALQPGNADAHISHGSTAQMLGRQRLAAQCYQRALEIDATRADVWANMGTLHQSARNLPAARECYQRAVDIDPSDAGGVAGLAALFELEGRYQDALALLRPIEDKVRLNPELCIVYARLLRRAGEYQQSEEVVRGLLARPGLTTSDVSRLNFMLGDTLAAVERYDDAFVSYQQANAAKQQTFDSAGHRVFVARVQAYFDADCLARAPQLARKAPRMVFILGMPRSGTTLVEQMLSCHSAVTAAGELEILAQLLTQESRLSGDFPEALAQLDAAGLESFADEYQRRVAQRVGEASIVTDKMPGNWLYIGLIQMLFPDARIVHCRRNALDTAVSLYCKDFAHAALPYAYDIASIGSVYRDYRTLMDHWQRVITLPLLNVDYEQMVSDTENQCRRIVEFVDLEWEAQCLDFHRSSRVTFTASNAQVRKPIYSSAVNRHQNYARHLGPLREALGDYAPPPAGDG